jgi:hypothetical protein
MKAGLVAFYQAYSTLLISIFPFPIRELPHFVLCVLPEALLKLGFVPASPVQMQTVVEEECSGNGTLHLSNQFKGFI